MAAPEATITNYGLSNAAPVISYYIEEAYQYPGYVVKVSTTASKMKGTTALTDIPDGCLVKSTVPATMQAIAAYTGASDGTAQVNEYIGVQAFIPGQEYYLMLGATVAVSVGDLMGPSTQTGRIQPRNSTGSLGSAGVVFCKALEAKDAQAGGTAYTVIRVRVITPVYLTAGVNTT